MIRFAADYFDGQTSRAHPVEATVEAGQLLVQGENIAFALPLDRIQVAPPAGQARSVVHLPDARELHSADRAALLELNHLTASARPERWAHLLESRLRFALAALVVSVFIVFAGLRWGVPAVALLATHTLPGWVEQRIGEEALALMDRVSLSPSKLPAVRRQALEQKLAAQCSKQACPPFRLLFRDSRLFGANAMALPGGSVVVTDALVRLSHQDDEVLAVVAHELGHVQHRHGLRLALQSIGAGAILVAVTGDIGSVTDLAAGLPSLLLQNGYSRDMEREADAYALAWLKTACIPPARFADILGRIDTGAADKTSLLDSHPGTQERIKPFLTAGGCT
ncbi:MAG: M48 family metallopeptidase [Thiobacillus sp.]|uniref:M48 family metallopeptidase n=1 Tax=Thiobacillus sp. TaxID=924 RepID=UPI002895435C|nr:M48 family metallopeptidase [Thiobacillus sp.]MDT3705326.1 M48 family metallopeptidase [Thiobacillus sp.]